MLFGKSGNFRLCIQGALDYADERSSAAAGVGLHSSPSSGQSESGGQGPLIFLHAGNYRGEFLVIDSDIALIGKTILLLAHYY